MQLLCEAYIELAYVNVMQLKYERGTLRPARIEQPIALHIMYLFRVKFNWITMTVTTYFSQAPLYGKCFLFILIFFLNG